MIELIRFDSTRLYELVPRAGLDDVITPIDGGGLVGPSAPVRPETIVYPAALKPEATYIHGAVKKLWVERFDGTGEVTIEGPLSADLMGQLPKGSIVSHLRTQDLMRIDSHLIEGELNGEPKVKIVGSQIASATTRRTYGDGGIPEHPNYKLIEEEPATVGNTDLNSEGGATELTSPKLVVERLLRSAIHRAGSFNLRQAFDIRVEYIPYPSNAFFTGQYLDAKKAVDTIELDSTKFLGDVISGILKDHEIGIQVFRMEEREINRSGTTPIFVVHGGADRTGDGGVHLSVGSNSVKKYSSLQSDKNVKNVAVVHTKYFEFLIYSESMYGQDISPFQLNELVVDASHADDEYDEYFDALGNVANIIQKAGNYATAELNRFNKGQLIVEVDISTDNPQYEYRRDFNLGDIVSIDSSAFFDPQPMRVVEFVESEERGIFSSYPVLKGVAPGWQFNAHTPALWGSIMGDT